MAGRDPTISKSASVLVVEDEAHMLLLLEKILIRRGYRVLKASNGQAALDMYQRHKGEIDAIMLDMGLPKISGRDVLRQIMSQNPDVNVVVTSGYIKPELKLEISHRRIKFVRKPYTPDDVCNALQDLIESAS